MTTYNTGNDIGSAAPKDLYDNAENLDAAVNGDAKVWTDRLGRERVSMRGVEEAVPDAIAARDAAQTAKTQAELARDASFVTGPKYATEAIGRSAVADGVNFLVQGSGNVAAYEYRRTNSATSVPIATYPSKSAVDGLGQVFDSSRFTFQGYVSNGTYFANAVYRATDYLRVEAGASYFVTTASAGTLTNDWYDINKVFISSFQSPPAISTVTVAAPVNARFLRVSNTTAGASDSRSGVQAVVPEISISQVLKIVGDNPPTIPSINVTHGVVTVKAKLDEFEAQQAAIIAQQANLLNSLDLLSDVSASFFFNTWGYVQSIEGTPSGAPIEIEILSRISDDTFEIDPSQSANLGDLWDASIVVHDSENDQYKSYVIKNNDAGTVSVHGILPAHIDAVQAMHDANLGQHLSRFGYKGLADALANSPQKYAYKKKKPIFYFHAPSSSSPAYTDPNVYNFDNSEKLFDVTPIGGALPGGFVPGTTSLTRRLVTGAMDEGLSVGPGSTFTSRSYGVTQNIAGQGIEFKFNALGVDGFIDIPVAAVKRQYDTDGVTTGRARLEVLGDGVAILDKIYEAGVVNYLKIPFSGVREIKIRLTLADSVPSVLRLYGVYAYAKSPDTPIDVMFSSGDVVGFLGDSWTQFPPPIAGEVRPLRPDGSIADGMQFLSVRLKEKLAQEGVSITTLNMGQGGRTSAWGRFWVDKMIALTPKLTHCVVCFYINDSNSRTYDPESNYTIDPGDMWGSKNLSQGGVKGVVSAEEWYENLQWICARLLRAGIKPIVFMPSQTASAGQSQSIQQNLLNKIAAGFNTVNADGGRI